MKDGLGKEELVYTSGASMYTQNPIINGSLTVFEDIAIHKSLAVTGSAVITSDISATDVKISQSVIHSAGSPFKEGTIINQLPTNAIISGGMWTAGSGVAGSEAISMPAWASCSQPLGYCVATTASGSNPEILTQGIAPFIAEADISAGDSVKMGAGGALNCVVAIGSQDDVFADVGKGRGIAVTSAGSEETLFVYLN